MRNFIELISSFFTGVIASIIYIPLTRLLFSCTYTYTQILYELLKKIPCNDAACQLRLYTSLLVFVIRDTLFALPVLFIFGLILGSFLKYYRLSRPVALCAGFFFAQYCYTVIAGVVSEYPLYVHIARALPIVLLFIYFSKLGYSLKLKRRFGKIGRAIELEEKQDVQNIQ